MASDATAPTLPAAASTRPSDRPRHRDLPSVLPAGAARFVGASLATTGLSLVVLVVLVATGTQPLLANLVATSIGAVASYRLNRSWVWAGRHGGGNSAELAAFWGLALAGLALSTLAVSVAGTWASASGASGRTTALAVAIANWTTFLALAGLKFLMSRRLYRLAAPEPRRSPCRR